MTRGPRVRTECRRLHGPENYRRYGTNQVPQCRVCRGFGGGHRKGAQDTERAVYIVSAIHGGLTLEAVGQKLGITRERVRQVYKAQTGHGVPPMGVLCTTCKVRYLGPRGAHKASDEHQHQLRLAKEARFWERVDMSAGVDACWPWLGHVNRQTGYGSCHTFGESNAHRVAYVITNGPLPRGRGRARDLEVDHLCRRPDCVNPAHLEAVTHQENSRRGLLSALRPWHQYTREGQPVRRREQLTHCKRGHDLTDPANVDVFPSTGRMCRPCRRRREADYRARRDALRAAA